MVSNKHHNFWHNDINTFLLSLELIQSQADPNLYLRSDGILMLLYVDDISLLFPKEATKAAIEVKARISEKCNITNLGPARQFLGIKFTARTTEPAPASVFAKRPSTLRFSNNSIRRLHMMYQLQWIVRWRTIWPRIGGRKNSKISQATRQLSAHWCTRHLQLGPISHSQSQLFADTIPNLSPAISLLPKEFSNISNPPPTFDCIVAAAPAAMINSEATRTRIGPMIVPTANLKVVTSSFPATELSCGSHKSKFSSPCQPSKPITSLVLRAPVKQSEYTSSTKIYTAKMHLRSRSIVTIRAHLVISQLAS